MDAYEATRIVLSRIQNLDPENASKIMGLLLIQDHGEKEMIRLAFGPESLVHSVVIKARKDLGLASNSPNTPLSPSSPFLPSSLCRQNSSSRLLPSPLSIPNHSWDATNCFSEFSPESLISPNSSLSSFPPLSSNSSNTSCALTFYGNGNTDLVDEFQLQDQLSFLNDGSPSLGPKNPDFFYPHHDLATDDSACGFGWKPCLYYARGYCKNGNSCRFFHGPAAADVGSDGGSMVGSPEQCHELLRSKSAHQQRLTFPYSALAANKCMSLLQQQQSDSPRALLMGEDMHKFGRSRLDRSEFSMNPGSRQIYLTFPADSTFREEDVSNYFSIYGPVQDVRIPYQQKRMFGFVTFVYPETVKLILAKGNPHFVCDARVLVKPYKEKGKVPDKYRKLQQQMERGDFSACGSPTGLDSRDPYDLQLGGRLLCDAQDVLWRRKLEEQADLQQAIELQGRRLMGLQLLDVKRPNHYRALSSGAAFPSPINSPSFFNHTLIPSLDRSGSEVIKENGSNPAMFAPVTVAADQQSQLAANVDEKERENEKEKERVKERETYIVANGSDEKNGNDKESNHKHEESDYLLESLEHNLPDSPFASPKACGDYLTALSDTNCEVEKNAVVPAAASANNNLISTSLLPATSTLDMASFKSCYFHVPRFSSSHGAIGM
ncbi:Zinc finger CCCH domain-containing protein [Actinidia chinensis var. chinensis]|uniref:Zinc finger CCCH domain-containing protein n=1 Tax=Actinidia chinensis var. chinensis TaxID=1590841 RepID=A0A2R6QKN6_ACTCC|nr:Zinc finger CCCH domain-containing protein [Actinidia chinensis var. chinensis]